MAGAGRKRKDRHGGVVSYKYNIVCGDGGPYAKEYIFKLKITDFNAELDVPMMITEFEAGRRLCTVFIPEQIRVNTVTYNICIEVLQTTVAWLDTQSRYDVARVEVRVSEMGDVVPSKRWIFTAFRDGDKWMSTITGPDSYTPDTGGEEL